MQINSKESVKQGTTIEYEGSTYIVLSCIDLEWLYNGLYEGYLLNLSEVLQ